MFIDKVQITVQAGNGGNGTVSFRHEKFIDRGGPDGGDGGDGGDVVFVASNNQNTLANFRYKKLLVASSGEDGSKQKKHGKSGKDLVVKVPVGTVVYNEKGDLLADLVTDEQTSTVAKAGQGGFGNAHFVSSKRQAPTIAEKGGRGEKLELTLELKLIADIGVIGLPNAGKSTLLSRISNAKPEIANYPFTTISPNLGVVDIDNSTSLLFADIPGLIKGASLGKGLGDEFLRHIERTKIIIHLIDAYNDDIKKAYKTIQNELSSYKIDLSGRPQIVVVNKIEGLDEDIINDIKTKLQKALPRSTKVLFISAKSGKGVKELLWEINRLFINSKTKKTVKSKLGGLLPVIKLPETANSWEVTKNDDVFVVSGRKIENFAQKTDFNNPEGVVRLRNIMRKMGIMHELSRMRAEPNQKITIGKNNIGEIEF